MSHGYHTIISIQNLCGAWQEFVKGKKFKKDVAEFSLDLSKNIYSLHQELCMKSYRHGHYEAFSINDPKPRDIHKASVRDRLLHHALHRVLYPYFDKKFINDSYSCRVGKGAHRALERFRVFVRKVSRNNTKTVWVLKCDVKKFFASIDHEILLTVLGRHISDKDTLRILENIIRSFNSGLVGKGLPLGNLTSQLLVNVYMNEFDQFVKHRLKAKYYIRYADDFVVMSSSREYLQVILVEMQEYLRHNLRLVMHPNKVSVKTLASGVDFLGWIHFPKHRVLRTTTKKRMFRNIEVKEGNHETVQSYLGMLQHGNSWKLRQEILDWVNIVA